MEFTRTLLIGISVALIGTVITYAASPNTINLSTGAASYTITSDSNGANDGMTAYVVTTFDTNWISNPITNGVAGIGGVWIAPNANQSVGSATSGANGTTVYQTTFSLAGYDPATALLTMNLTGDDFVASVTLNGTTIFTPTAAEVANNMQNTTSGTFTVTGPFNAGVNTLVFTVDNFQGDGYTGPSYGYGGPTGLAVAASITFNSSTEVFPHVAADTEWQTDFLILNTSSSPVSYTLTLHPDSGGTVPIAGQGSVSEISGTVDANGTAYYTTAATADSDGWAELTSTAPLTGVAVFREANDQTSVLLNTPSTSFVVSFDSTAPPNSPTTPYVDGLAIANPSATTTATISCQAYDSTGKPLGGALTGTSVAPLGHIAFVLQNTAPFTSLPANTRGQLACTSTTAVAAVELRGLGAQISTLPVVTQ